jgi:SAM-dependent methyltransferase
MNSHSNRRSLAFAYAVTVFASAFLLFQVQPLMGKFIIPWFGGSPAVWTTCMLVFQVLLFAGYAYAHLATQLLQPRIQIALHLTLLIVAMLTLPIAPGHGWKPVDGEAPAARIMLLMTCCVGLPYFILSSTGPLVQSWFSRTHEGQSPYRLYSLSNVGSLLALVSYPFVFEPSLAVTTQSVLWSGMFVLFAAMCGYSGWRMLRIVGNNQHVTVVGGVVERNTSRVRPTLGMVALWFMLAMTPSILLLASTNQVCMDVAVIPFLWVLPLALYLISFILTFDSDRWYVRKNYFAIAMLLLLGTVCLSSYGSSVPILIQIAIYFGSLFAGCMVCHGELAALRPHPQQLTKYFLVISAGGAAGGLFVGLIAPKLFVSYYELQIGCLCFLMAYFCVRVAEDGLKVSLPGWVAPLGVASVLLIAVGIMSQLNRNPNEAIHVSRNFYGVLKVERVFKPDVSNEPMLELVHGRISHGSQFLSDDSRSVPTAYYATNTGIGKVMQRWHSDRPRRIGIVGLGVGTLAAYGRDQDYLRLYEINPDVISIAQNNFTFLRDCLARQEIVPGDARLSLDFEEPQDFDVLVLDAFSGDAIPIHLLTSEAMEVYTKHLSNDGVIAFHISNLHFNLRPVIAGLAEKAGLSYRFIGSGPNPQAAALPSVWALLTNASEQFVSLDTDDVQIQGRMGSITRPVMWTDAKNNLLEVLW